LTPLKGLTYALFPDCPLRPLRPLRPTAMIWAGLALLLAAGLIVILDL
jgi:hypothetical protein